MSIPDLGRVDHICQWWISIDITYIYICIVTVPPRTLILRIRALIIYIYIYTHIHSYIYVTRYTCIYVYIYIIYIRLCICFRGYSLLGVVGGGINQPFSSWLALAPFACRADPGLQRGGLSDTDPCVLFCG